MSTVKDHIDSSSHRIGVLWTLGALPNGEKCADLVDEFVHSKDSSAFEPRKEV